MRFCRSALMASDEEFVLVSVLSLAEKEEGCDASEEDARAALPAACLVKYSSRA